MPLVLTKPTCDGIGNVIKGLITGLAVDPNTKVTCNWDYSLGHYDTVLDSRHIYHGEQPEILFGGWRFLILKEEEDEQADLPQYFSDLLSQSMKYPGFSGTKSIDLNYDVSKVSNKIRERILNTIHSIVFQPHIHEWVNKTIQHIDTSRTVGISVRTWKAKHETNIPRSYSADDYKNAIRSAIVPGIRHVILSVDTPEIEQEYIDFLATFPVSITLLRKESYQNETQHAFVKMLVLSKCTTVVGSLISTFTELVFWFGDCKPKIIPVGCSF